jgi:hypothetical protein
MVPHLTCTNVRIIIIKFHKIFKAGIIFHMWYGRNRGQEIEKEFLDVIKGVGLNVGT